MLRTSAILGRALDLMARQNGMRNADLVKALDCSDRKVRDRRQGRAWTVDDLEKVAEVFGCGVAEFVQIAESLDEVTKVAP